MKKILFLFLIQFAICLIISIAEEERLDKKPNEAQRSKVKTGDFVTYLFKTSSVPKSNLDSEYQIRYTVIEVKDDKYKLMAEILKGTPTKDMPMKSEHICQLADVPEIPIYYLNKKVGERKKEDAIKATVFRDTDKQITINNKKLICKNFKITWDLPNGQASELIWFCPDEIPLMIKLKTKTEHKLIVSGRKLKINQSEELIGWGRIK